MNVEFLGQVFTPRFVVDKILSLRRNKGNCMEPSCGDGAISSMIEGVIAIEYDKNVCPNYALNMDFFDKSPLLLYFYGNTQTHSFQYDLMLYLY